jgi:hypothetical protein
MSWKLAMRLLSSRNTAKKGTPAQAEAGGTLASRLDDKSCDDSDRKHSVYREGWLN